MKPLVAQNDPALASQAFLEVKSCGRTIAKYRKGETVFVQGSSADAVFYILKGKIKVTVVSKQGKEAVVAVLGPNEYCGEGCLTEQPKRLATASAMTECELMRLEKPAMIRKLQEEPAYSEFFIVHLLARISRVEADLVDQLFNSSEKRLARVLLLLANFDNADQSIGLIEEEVSQEMFAEMIGTTRSRVNFFMNKFRRMGFIEYKGKKRGSHLKVHSLLLNQALLDKLHFADGHS